MPSGFSFLSLSPPAEEDLPLGSRVSISHSAFLQYTPVYDICPGKQLLLPAWQPADGWKIICYMSFLTAYLHISL